MRNTDGWRVIPLHLTSSHNKMSYKDLFSLSVRLCRSLAALSVSRPVRHQRRLARPCRRSSCSSRAKYSGTEEKVIERRGRREESRRACECTSRGSERKGVHVLVLQKMMFQVFLEFPLRHRVLVLTKMVF